MPSARLFRTIRICLFHAKRISWIFFFFSLFVRLFLFLFCAWPNSPFAVHEISSAKVLLFAWNEQSSRDYDYGEQRGRAGEGEKFLFGARLVCGDSPCDLIVSSTVWRTIRSCIRMLGRKKWTQRLAQFSIYEYMYVYNRFSPFTIFMHQYTEIKLIY